MRFYKNLKISAKLIIGFLCVAVIAGVIGVVGIISLNKVGDDAKLLYVNATEPMVPLAEALNLYQQNRVELRNLVLIKNDTALHERVNTIRSNADQIAEIMNEAAKTSVEAVTVEMFNNFNDAYSKYLVNVELVIGQVLQGDLEAASESLLDQTMGESATMVQNLIESLLNKKVAGGNSQYNKILDTSKTTKITMITLSFAGILLAMTLGLMVSRSISKPIGHIVEAANKLAVGDIEVEVEADSKDETGILANAFKTLANAIKEQTRLAERMAEGDFSMAIELRSEKDVLGKALNEMIDQINELMGNITSSAEQVASGAKQISDSSVVLSEGSTEQASSVEELTASLEQISSQTKHNADNANKANALTRNVKDYADQGNKQMKEMLEAMGEINVASNNINKIIKVIDDIAFQTNILALNAAVEAARAGQYGKGFAVVAEEVRTLAAKSADAAKETTELIENSIAKVNDGTRIASQTAESLNTIVNEIDKVYDLINEIANASNEQALGISQVNQGIIQVSDVVQTNSATAQESAAASEELASHAQLLENMVSKFKLRHYNQRNTEIKKLNPEILSMIESIVNKNQEPNQANHPLLDGKPSIVLSDSEFGKY